MTYLETVGGNGLPSADSFHFHMRKVESTENIHRNFIELTGKQLKKLKGKKVVLLIDETHEPFYGNVNNNPLWVHEYKPGKGCSGSFKFLCSSIIVDGRMYFIDASPISMFDSMKIKLEETFETMESYGLRIEAVLMDRGFSKSSEIIDLLNRRKLRYLMLYPGYKNVEKIAKETELYKRIPFEVKGVKTTLVIIRDEKYDWKFVTNMIFKDFVKYIKVYKKRWNIETGFRVADEARIKTKSLDIRVRYFLFLVGLILCNLWHLLGRPIPFRKFLIKFLEILESLEFSIKIT